LHNLAINSNFYHSFTLSGFMVWQGEINRLNEALVTSPNRQAQAEPAEQEGDTPQGCNGPQPADSRHCQEIQATAKQQDSASQEPTAPALPAGVKRHRRNGRKPQGQGVEHLILHRRLVNALAIARQNAFEGMGTKRTQGHRQKTKDNRSNRVALQNRFLISTCDHRLFLTVTHTVATDER